MIQKKQELHQKFVSRQTHSRDDVSTNQNMCPQLFMELFLKSHGCFRSDTGGLNPVLFSQRFNFTELEERD